MSAPDYKYDVFFSYKRHPMKKVWIARVAALIKHWMLEEGIGSGEIFVDVETIEDGAHWPTTLREALRTSRCLVAVWTAPYFQSQWCLSEWETFKRRQEIVGSELIVPMCFHDGEHFPQAAKETQSHDVRDFAFTMDSFWETKRAVELEAEIKKMCVRVGKILNSPQPFDPNWPVVEANVLSKAPDVPRGRL